MDVIEGPAGHRVCLLSVVRGLVTEKEKVRRAIDEISPQAVALSISEEELDALWAYAGEETPPSNFEEEFYMAALSKFGEVKKPPPCFLEARDLAKEKGMRLESLDLNNEDFTEAYVTNVSTIEMMTQSWLQNKLRNRRFRADTPEEFVIEFDSIVNRKKGFQQLERAREEHMARRLADLLKERERILAVIEAERVAGVGQALRSTCPCA